MQAIRRVVRIERQIRASSLQDPKQTDDHLGTAPEANPNQVVWSYALTYQKARNLVGSGIELRVRYYALAVYECRGLRL
jgi:hypothetical protein